MRLGRQPAAAAASASGEWRTGAGPGAQSKAAALIASKTAAPTHGSASTRLGARACAGGLRAGETARASARRIGRLRGGWRRTGRGAARVSSARPSAAAPAAQRMGDHGRAKEAATYAAPCASCRRRGSRTRGSAPGRAGSAPGSDRSCRTRTWTAWAAGQPKQPPRPHRQQRNSWRNSARHSLHTFVCVATRDSRRFVSSRARAADAAVGPPSPCAACA